MVRAFSYALKFLPSLDPGRSRSVARRGKCARRIAYGPALPASVLLPSFYDGIMMRNRRIVS
jgi:hypothetical protein